MTRPSWSIVMLTTGYTNNNNKLKKGKALRNHSMDEETAASVLLKLFIRGYE